MGSNWSSSGGAKREAVVASPLPPATSPALDPPLHLDDIRAETAAWGQDGICRSLQRFLGLLPDSPGEVLKQQQRYPVFVRRPSTAAVAMSSGDGRQQAAVVAVQRVYRRFRLLRMWHEAALPLLEVARELLEAQREAEQAEVTAASFRQMLVQGFAANKVAISGELKTVRLQLVSNAEKEEFYLTWTPSRKRSPRIYLHDIEDVVPVKKEGNRHAPRLAGKVSHYRGLIVLCRSHHRGRVVLEVGSKQECALLLRGFASLLEELRREEPVLDDAGALRRRQAKRRSVADFFDTSAAAVAVAQTLTRASRISAPSRPTAASLPFTRPQAGHEDAGHNASKPLPIGGSGATDSPPRRRLSIEELYRTSFDPPSPVVVDMDVGGVSKSLACSPAPWRSSAGLDVPVAT